MGRNIPGGKFLGGSFPGRNFPGRSLMGGNFPGGNFPRTVKSNLFQTLSYVSWDSKPGFVLSLFLNFLPKLIKTFVVIKLFI